MASQSSAACRLPSRASHDWQDNGEARHIGVRLECGIRLENVYVPAGGDTPDRSVNPKFGQKLDFIERMTRWSEGLSEPTIIVGDFNVAPLECDVWSHKALLTVVSHTPVEVEALGAAAASARMDRHRPQVRPRPRTLLHLVELPLARLDEKRPRAQARPYVGLTRAFRPPFGPSGARTMPQLAAAIGPRTVDLRDRNLTLRRAIAALRAGRPVNIEGAQPIGILAVETATAELLDIVDPQRKARLLISGERAAALSLANLREAADPSHPVLVERAAWLDANAALALADPGQDLERGPIGPLNPVPLDCAECAEAALDLARSAGLLPALWVIDGKDAAISVSAESHRARRPPTRGRARRPREASARGHARYADRGFSRV